MFPFLSGAGERPGVVAYTATRWGTLLEPTLIPQDERPPTAGDCYRFALSHPSVDVCLAAPVTTEHLDHLLSEIEKGPMQEDELAWMKRVGVAVKTGAAARQARSPVAIVDRMLGWIGGRSESSRY